MKKKEAVELYGSEKCKKHFAKYKKFTNKDLENCLLRTLNQVYESVEIERQGKAYVYVLGDKREEVAVREDNRINNGAWSIPYTKNMDVIVVSVLEDGQVNETAQTLSKWSLDFGLITPQMYDLLSAKHQETFRHSCLNELKEKGVIFEGEERILFDYISEIKSIQKQLAGTLERMKKANIIEYYLVPKGFIEEGKQTVNLHESTVKKIIATERELKEYYNVDEWYLNTFYNAPKSREYRKKWEERLSQITDEHGIVIGLSFWYKTYAIILKARKKKIIRYLEIYNKEAIELFKQKEALFLSENEKAFHKKRANHVVEKAEEKEDNFLAEKIKTVNINEYVAEIYETTTKTTKYFNQKHMFEYDSGYYALYFDRLYSKRIEELQNYYGHNFI